MIPATPETITADWLTSVFSKEVADVDKRVIGTGKMGDNLRLSVQFEGGELLSVVAKLPAADETSRQMAGAMGAYRKEVMFYKDMAMHTSMRLPKIYHADIDESGTEFILLMEDLAPAEPGDQLIGESQARVLSAVEQAAKLHSDFYGQTKMLAADYVTKTDVDAATFGQALLQEQWPGFVDRFGHGLNKACLAFGEQYMDKHVTWSQLYTGPKTLLHGDFRSENMLFGPNEDVATVDWQTFSEGSGLCDIAYLLGGSMQIELRRRCERAVVEHYRSKLAVELSDAECWQQYRLGTMHGIMITVLGAMFSGADERGDRMFLAMIQRHLQHCVDLDAAEFLS